MDFLLSNILCIFVLLYSLKRKEYRYTFSAAFTLMYFLFAALQNNYEQIDNSQLFGTIQKLILLALAAYMIFTAIKSANRKGDIPAVIFACAACTARFLRSFVFDSYTDRMALPGADVMVINEEFTLCCLLVDAGIRFALLLMLFCIAWYLGRDTSKTD